MPRQSGRFPDTGQPIFIPLRWACEVNGRWMMVMTPLGLRSHSHVNLEEDDYRWTIGPLGIGLRGAPGAGAGDWVEKVKEYDWGSEGNW